MIAVDTSALMAIVLHEPEFPACMAALQGQPGALLSAGTQAEALIVALGRGVTAEMHKLFVQFDFEVVPVTKASALRIGIAYARWGKGVHPAGLNYGDCFAYDVAITHACPLLFIGDDFSRTDVTSAL